MNAGGRDNEGVRKTDAGPVTSSQLGRSPCNGPGRGLDGRREGFDERIDRVALSTALAQRRHEDLGIRRRRDHESVASIAGGSKRVSGTLVVDVFGVQDRDQHAGVENRQVHSRRRSSR